MGCSASSACAGAELGKISTQISSSIAPQFIQSGSSADDFHKNFKLGAKLGEGAFGQVLKATASEGGEPVAVKVLIFRGGNSLSDVKAEACAWQLVSGHENVVQLRQAFFGSKLGYLVMELCTVTVMDMLVSNKRGGEADLAKAFRGMLLGLAHVHKVGVVHRDVKPDNFLLGGPEGQIVKLADFGMAVQLPKSGLLYDVAGTAPYMSLQMVRGEGYSQATDLWSMGVTAYLTLFGEFPFGRAARNAEQMKKAIAKGESPLYRPSDPCLSAPSSAAIAFARCLTTRQPLQRPSAGQALELPFVRPSAASVEALSKPGAVASAKFELQPVVQNAQKLTSRLVTKPAVNPTVQRDLDELLQRLQAKHKSEVAAGAPRLTRSFSGEEKSIALGSFWKSPDEDDLAKESEEDSPLLVHRRLRKASTHNFTPTTTLDSLPPITCGSATATLESLPPITKASANDDDDVDDDDDDGENSVSSVASASDTSTANGGVGFFDARSNCTASQVNTLDSLPPLQMPSMPAVAKWSGAEAHEPFLAPSILRPTANDS